VIHINGRDIALSTERLKTAFLPNGKEVLEEKATENTAMAHDILKKKCDKPKKVCFAPIHP